MSKKIAVIRGDGIGNEIITEAINVLEAVAERLGYGFEFTEVLMGGCAIDATGSPLPQETIDVCLNSDSVLLGAVGGSEWDNVSPELRPEKGLLGLRSALKLFANIRPARLIPALSDACPLKDGITEGGLDLVIVRELIGGIYFGKRFTETDENGIKTATDCMSYNENEIERIARVAFNMAKQRRGRLHSVDKANVLDSSRLWREVMHRVKNDYPDVEYSDMFVDNCSMQLVRNPSQFDVIVTGNLFGDILSDEASMLTGSLGMLPSASLGNGTLGLYEPVHGSAPDIAGLDIANPIAAILSAAMMLRYSLDMEDGADIIELAVSEILGRGYRTADIMSEGMTEVSCSQMGELIASLIIGTTE